VTEYPPRPAVRRAGARLAVGCSILLLISAACAPPPEPATPAPLHTRFDSLTEAQARANTPEWRADHYPTADIHGPFARPPLPAGADPNDPVAYYKLGDSVKWRLQGLADRAFYWAVRLEPTMADAYFARWELRRHGSGYRLYPGDSVHRPPRPPPNEAAAVDSLRVSALMYNPFLDGALDVPPQITRLSERDADRDARTAGFWAYARGDYPKAVRKWGEAIGKSPENAPFHVPRAFAWVRMEQSDSAVADLAAFIDRLEKIQDSTIAPYLSKDFLYYAIGVLRAGQQRFAEARTAYERALLENLGFYMTHVRLSAVALALRDTATALNELETASLIRGDDPFLLTFRGSVLSASNRLDDAEQQLRAAMHADTDYALPYAFLGEVAERRHDPTAALRAYREYLDRASHNAPERPQTEERVKRLAAPVQRVP
jgi:tetratricopeptide (TPR) repeat protein